MGLGGATLPRHRCRSAAIEPAEAGSNQARGPLSWPLRPRDQPPSVSCRSPGRSTKTQTAVAVGGCGYLLRVTSRPTQIPRGFRHALGRLVCRSLFAGRVIVGPPPVSGKTCRYLEACVGPEDLPTALGAFARPGAALGLLSSAYPRLLVLSQNPERLSA